jgi:lipopolysaccharide biosynthesis glycosyltransferase
MLNIYIGYDPKEIAAYQVCAHSIIRNASQPVSISPLNIRHISGFTNTDYKASTEFAFTRFLVPYLSGYKGWSLFMDCDMLVRSDISKLFDCKNDMYDVMVVKHQYKPKEGDKFLNQEQTTYEKKNWSSVMLFNNEACQRLTKHYVNTSSGLHLHQFEWANVIGPLPKSWNHLVGEYSKFSDADIAHFTLGGPYFRESQNCEYADEWWQVWQESNSVLDVKVLGGTDVRIRG